VERRAAPRLACDREVALRPLPAGGAETYWASVRNVSAGGVGLLLSQFLPPGTAVAIGLPGKRPGESYLVAARVVHAGRKLHGNAYVGCAFAAEQGEEALRALAPRPAGRGPSGAAPA
jgi:hypothetical protein